MEMREKVQKTASSRWAWMREAMPKTAQMVADKRQAWGDAHVTQCLLRGMRGEPGWFFAREAAIAVGTPWQDDPEMDRWAFGSIAPGGAFVWMRSPTLQG